MSHYDQFREEDYNKTQSQIRDVHIKVQAQMNMIFEELSTIYKTLDELNKLLKEDGYEL